MPRRWVQKPERNALTGEIMRLENLPSSRTVPLSLSITD